MREQIIQIFKNNVSQRKIGRNLDILPSTVHNIIKRFKESGGISVCKGQGRKPKLNNRDLRSLRRHCIKNRHSSISDIPRGLRITLANLCQALQYVVTSTKQMSFKTLLCQKEALCSPCPEAPSTSLGSEASAMCIVVRRISISGIFWKKWTRTKEEKDHP